MHTRVELLGDADEDHTQIVGAYTVKLFGGYIPPCFGTTAWGCIHECRKAKQNAGYPNWQS